MASALEVGFQPDADHAVDQLFAEKVGGKAKDVGIVVAPAHFGSDAVVARRRAHALYFIGGDTHADAGAADQDAAVGFAGAHAIGDVVGEIGIVDAFGATRSYVNDFMAKRLQECEQPA